MKKLFIIFSTLAFLWAAPFGNRIIVPVLEIEGQFLYTPAMDLSVGESGFVVHEFEPQRTLNVARVEVIEIKDSKAKMSFKRYDSLDYNPFPHPKSQPQLGDSVVMRLFYDRAFLISPNQKTYLQQQAHYPDMQWLHPDLFAAYLLNENISAPRLNDFRLICETYSVGILYIIQKEYAQARDCQTFALLKQDEITAYTEEDSQILPFFSRFGTIKRTWLGALKGDKKITDYYLYYDQLIKESAH